MSYEIETERLWPALWSVLETVDHYWTFDARDDAIQCKDCDWSGYGPFLDCVQGANQHRNDVKRAVLKAAIQALTPQHADLLQLERDLRE